MTTNVSINPLDGENILDNTSMNAFKFRVYFKNKFIHFSYFS